jgi:hypothetical protein
MANPEESERLEAELLVFRAPMICLAHARGRTRVETIEIAIAIAIAITEVVDRTRSESGHRRQRRARLCSRDFLYQFAPGYSRQWGQ